MYYDIKAMQSMTSRTVVLTSRKVNFLVISVQFLVAEFGIHLILMNLKIVSNAVYL